MKEVFTHMDSSRVGHFKSLLEEAKIPCFVRNEVSQNYITGIPIPAFYPVLCVLNDADLPQALEILQAYQTTVTPSEAEWICTNCKSLVPKEFDTCWNCQHERS